MDTPASFRLGLRARTATLAVAAVVAVLGAASCAQRGMAPVTHYWMGADISWVTEMESRGKVFRNAAGEQMDCFELMKSLGVDAVRLRVWVDPSAHGGWCDTRDLLAKSRRAAALGMAIMVDFHYSDYWADPNKQNIPRSWSGLPYGQMRDSLYNHTVSVLSAMKAEGLEPRWVQVGNETSHGLLWTVRGNQWGDPIPDEDGNITILESAGHLRRNPAQYAGFIRAGYEAVKSVFPRAEVIVHLDNGFDQDLYDRNLDTLRKYGAKWDITGMSLYPYWALKSGLETDPEEAIDHCLANIGHVYEKYFTPVMIVETGFQVDESRPEVMETGKRQFSRIVEATRAMEGVCRGIFYWEPECTPGQYSLGAFTSDGRPTVIMDVYKEASHRAGSK